MQQTVANLPFIRRLEAVSFRAWPASTVSYEGSWQLRLTAAHSSKRINCIVPLDPSDYGHLDVRLSKAAKRFEDYGRPLLVRQTALMAPQIEEYLRSEGWSVLEEINVMAAPLADRDLSEGMAHLPGHDIGRFIEAYLSLSGEDASLRAGYAEILSSIKPTFGLFVKEEAEGKPLASVICVQDNDLAGVLSLAVHEDARRAGHGTEIVTSALRWARLSGAKTAWLQVTVENKAAIALYERFGFKTAYSYRYWHKGA